MPAQKTEHGALCLLLSCLFALALSFAPTAKAFAAAEGQSGGVLGGFATDPNEPVQIESDTLEVHDQEHTATFIGNVLTTQGQTKMRSDRLKANYAPSPAAAPEAATPASTAPAAPSGSGTKIKDLFAYGNVHVLSKDDQSADGEWAHYTVSDRKIVMGDTVVLRQGKNVVRGTKLFIDLNSGQSRVISTAKTADSGTSPAGTPSKGRVRALFESHQTEEK